MGADRLQSTSFRPSANSDEIVKIHRLSFKFRHKRLNLGNSIRWFGFQVRLGECDLTF